MIELNKETYDFNDLNNIVSELVSENGCPWDRVQTHESLKKYLIEECYEVIDAIENGNFSNLCEELGDVLLQVVFHAELAKKEKKFDILNVVDGICKKMINRHLHIFVSEAAKNSDEVRESWEKIKKKEKGYTTRTEVLKSIPKVLPALIRAEKTQKKAAGFGFTYSKLEEAFEKFKEEEQELLNAIYKDKKGIEEEYGDLMFALVNISRFLSLNPEFALTNATEKFINRFEYIENATIAHKKEFEQMSIDELIALWNESKSFERPL